MKKVRQILTIRQGTTDLIRYMQGRYKSTFHVSKSESPESSLKETYKEIIESFEKKLNEMKTSFSVFQKETNDTTQRLEKQTKELSKQVQTLSKDTSVHDELIKQNSENMEKAIKKEVLYTIKEYDFVTNSELKQEMKLLRDDIKEQFIAQEKLFDSKLSAFDSKLSAFDSKFSGLDSKFSAFDSKLLAVESRILTEFYKSRQEANRWRIASGLAAATLFFGFYEYNEGKLFNKPDHSTTPIGFKQ